MTSLGDRPRAPWLVLVASTFLLALPPAPARAGECGGVRMPRAATVDGTTLALRGMGVRKVSRLGFTVAVYVAGLYLEHPSRDAATILSTPQHWRLVLHLVRDVDREQITDAFTRAFQRTAPDDAGLQARIARLNGWITDMDEGGRVAFTYVPGTGLTVEVNDVVEGTVEGFDFASAFLDIWLGDHPPNPGLKGGLLGGPCV